MWIALALALLPAAVLVYLATLDGHFGVRRSYRIEAPADTVFGTVVDLGSWRRWSPWLLHEPDAEVTCSDDCKSEGGYYSWEGKVVGAGRLTHLEIRSPRSIRQRIEFVKPFRSSSEVNWEFETQDGATLVSWEMNGKMPFLFRFMASRTAAAIARDFDLGLALLGGVVNDRMDHPRISLDGRENLDAFRYWAIPCHGNRRQLESSRRGSIETLRASLPGGIGMSLTLYHRFDPYGPHYRAEIALPIGDNPPPSNYLARDFAGGRYCKATLQGDLRFLPLGWHALASHCRLHRIKPDKTRPALEIYHDDPASMPDGNRLVTTLYLPVRE